MKPLFVRLGLHSQEYTRGMIQAKKQMYQMKKNTDILARSFQQLKRIAITTFAGWSLKEIIKDIIDVGIEIDRMTRSMNAAIGSISGGAEAMQFLRDESERLGLVYKDQIKSYQQLYAAAKGTTISAKEVREIYLSVAEASTVMQLSQEQNKLALYALQQMISKGVVSMEELRRQLGDQIPGAFQIAARSMDMTTSELINLIKTGELLSSEFVPKFAKQLRKEMAGSVDDASQSIYANINRMKNTFFDLSAEVSESSGMMKSFSYILEEINDILASNEFREGLNNIMILVSDTADMIINLTEAMKNFKNETKVFGETIKSMPSGIPILEKYNPFSLKNWSKAYKDLRDGWKKLMDSFDETMPDTYTDFGKWSDGLEEVSKKTNEVVVDVQKLEKELDKLNKIIIKSYDAMDPTNYDIDYGFDEISAGIEKIRQKQMELNREAELTAKILIEGMPDTYDDYGKMTDALEYAVDEWEEIIKQGALSMRDSFSDLFFDAMVGDFKSFGDYLNDFFRSISRIISNYMAESLVNWGMDYFGFGNLGGRQHGGPVYPNKSYLVGERGPEIIKMGNTSGYVYPNSSISEGTEVNVSINNYTDSSVKVQKGTNPRDIFITIANDVNGGIIGRAIEKRFGLLPQTRKV